jgi:hypothetical protein
LFYDAEDEYSPEDAPPIRYAQDETIIDPLLSKLFKIAVLIWTDPSITPWMT